MTKTAWISLGLLVILAGIYFGIRDEPASGVQAPTTFAAVADLSRIEIVPPTDPDGANGANSADDPPDLIAFEKRDDAWQLTRPVESDLTASAAETLDGLFAEPTRADDIDLGGADPAEYGLDRASAVEVSAYSRDADHPAIELQVGNQITVPATHVQRTYVREASDDQMYRVQLGIGDFVRQPVSKFRNKSIAQFDRDAITGVTVEPIDASGGGGPEKASDGSSPAKLSLTKTDDAWTLVPHPEPGPDQTETVDDNKVRQWLGALARLRADGFADDQTEASAGLAPPRITVTVYAGQSTHKLRIGNQADDNEVYAQLDDSPLVTLQSSTVDRLTPSAQSLLGAKKDPKTAQNDAPPAAQAKPGAAAP